MTDQEDSDVAHTASSVDASDTSAEAAGSETATKRERRSPLWAKVTVTLGATLMLISGVAVVGVRTALGRIADSIPVADVLEEAGKFSDNVDDMAAEIEQLRQSRKRLTGAIDVLLLGIDVRSGQDRDNARADTIILLHVPASHDQAYLMSIPRDTIVDIPSAKNGWGPIRTKINAAFYRGAQGGGGWKGGMALMARTVSKLTGIKFDGAAVIDFGGFRQMIEAVGTVHICVEEDTESTHHRVVNGVPTYMNETSWRAQQYPRYVHKKGCRDMAGWEALDYSRIRKTLTDGDYGRQRHQQQLIKALVKKVASAGVLGDLNKANQLLDAVGESLILDTNKVPLFDFLFALRDLAGADLVLLKTNAGWFNGTGDGGESLDAMTLAMFQAAKDDTLGQFVLENPDIVNNDG